MMIVKRNMLFGLFPFLLLMTGNGKVELVGYHGRTAEPEEKAGDVNPGAEIEFFRQPPGKGQTQKKTRHSLHLFALHFYKVIQS